MPRKGVVILLFIASFLAVDIAAAVDATQTLLITTNPTATNIDLSKQISTDTSSQTADTSCKTDTSMPVTTSDAGNKQCPSTSPTAGATLIYDPNKPLDRTATGDPTGQCKEFTENGKKFINCYGKTCNVPDLTKGYCTNANFCVATQCYICSKWGSCPKAASASNTTGGTLTDADPAQSGTVIAPAPVATQPATTPTEIKPVNPKTDYTTAPVTGATQPAAPRAATPAPTPSQQISNTANTISSPTNPGAVQAPSTNLTSETVAAGTGTAKPATPFAGNSTLNQTTGLTPTTGAPAPTAKPSGALAATNPSTYTQQPSTFASASPKPTAQSGSTFSPSSNQSTGQAALSMFTNFISTIGSVVGSAVSNTVQYVKTVVAPTPKPAAQTPHTLTLAQAFPQPMQVATQASPANSNTVLNSAISATSPTQTNTVASAPRKIVLTTSQLSGQSSMQSADALTQSNTDEDPYTNPDLILTNHQVRGTALSALDQTTRTETSVIKDGGTYQAQTQQSPQAVSGKPSPSSALTVGGGERPKNYLPITPVSAQNYSIAPWVERLENIVNDEQENSLISYWNPPSSVTAGTPIVAGIPTSNFGVFINTLVGRWTHDIPNSWEQARMDLAIAEAQSNMVGLLAQIDSWREAQNAQVCDSLCESSLQALEAGRPIQEATIQTLLKKRAEARFALESVRFSGAGDVKVADAHITCDEAGICSVQNFPLKAVDEKTASAVMSYEYATRIIQEEVSMPDPVPPPVSVDRNILDQVEHISSALNQLQATLQRMVGATGGGDIAVSAEDELPSLNATLGTIIYNGGLDLYSDSDHDGISDYDEIHIYETNPLNAYTAGSSLADGERVLFGLDVHSTSLDRVAVESPRLAGTITDKVFEVYSIDVATSTAGVAGTGSITMESTTVMGRALPNSFVTLYMFSTPVVVTVKADMNGLWSYTFDLELQDGDHELYVATIDSSGKIIAKSPVVPFFKRASAAAFTPLLMKESPAPDPLDSLRNTLLLAAFLGAIFFGVAGIIILGYRRGSK